MTNFSLVGKCALVQRHTLRLKYLGMTAGFLALVVVAGSARATTFVYDGTIDTYTVSMTGDYDITLAGGQGGTIPWATWAAMALSLAATSC
jgi:hypothetical protein